MGVGAQGVGHPLRVAEAKQVRQDEAARHGQGGLDLAELIAAAGETVDEDERRAGRILERVAYQPVVDVETIDVRKGSRRDLARDEGLAVVEPAVDGRRPQRSDGGHSGDDDTGEGQGDVTAGHLAARRAGGGGCGFHAGAKCRSA